MCRNTRHTFDYIGLRLIIRQVFVAAHDWCRREVTEPDRINLGYAVSLAKRFNAGLTVLYSDESRKNADLSQTKETLCNRITETVQAQCDIKPVVRKGNAADQIITHARKEKEGLIVLRAYHQIFQDAAVLEKTTDLVVRHAPVPVLIIPTFSKS